MDRWVRKCREFLAQQDGPTAVEYAVMLALIVAVCIAAVTTLGQKSAAVFQDVTSKIPG